MSAVSRFFLADTDFQIIRNDEVTKHGSHDQKTHGNWATGGTIYTSLIDKLSQKRTPGFSLDLRTKTSPKTGYIASDKGAERVHDWAEVSSSRDALRQTIKSYVKDHAELLTGKGTFFGGWVEDGKLFLDVSRRYNTRSEGVRAGFRNEQKAIYDVINDSYIYMEDEIDDRAEKARISRDAEASQGNDGARVGRIYGRNPFRDRGQSLSGHICLGRYTGLQKHLDGQHDQRTHGNWAGDRYPDDSVKSARDGALEYAYKKGLKYDQNINYREVVANRARAERIADAYEDLPKRDRDAIDEYEALANEVEEQFDYMTKTLGVKVEFVADDPYKTSKEMFEDVSQGSLKVLQTESTGAHPLFTDLQNNKFRAVHDYFGHAATGRGFGQDGEEAAWVHHSQMFSDKARGALTTETRGQNSFFNNRGKQFADQKVALLPEEFWRVPTSFSKVAEIHFDLGLKPFIKHLQGEHDQSKHGRWASAGYTAEESERIASWENRGVSLEEIDATMPEEQIGLDREAMIEYISNNSDLYETAMEDYDVQGSVQTDMESAREAGGITVAGEYIPYPEEGDQRGLDSLEAKIYEDLSQYAMLRYAQNNEEEILERYSMENEIPLGTADLLDGFNEVYGVKTEGKGDFSGVIFESKVQDATWQYEDGQHKLLVVGTVKADGDIAGTFERTIFRDGDQWAVEHKWFALDDEYRGSGFGKEFLQQAEDYYTAKGFAYIKLEAGLEDGARHWARAGFDWNPDSFGFNLNQLDNASVRMSAEGQAEFMRLRNNFLEPLPAEYANIGWDRRTKDSNGEWQWDGKELMSGLRLNYVKVLTAEGRNLLQGPIDRDGDGLVYDGTNRERPAPQS